MIVADTAFQRFEQAEVWGQGYDDDPAWMEKHRLMEAMLPEDVETILDVGCGNGVQARLLARRYQVIGADGSDTALRLAKAPCLRAWSHDLPVASRSFDVVWSSQLLEHLPDDLLKRTVAEMQRVARSWVLISVPYRERLRFRQCRCHSCGGLFHIYGHLQSFDVLRLEHVMHPCRLKSWAFCGPPDKHYHAMLLMLRQTIGRKWFSYPPASPVCPHCGHLETEVWEGNRVARWCDRLNAQCVRSHKTPSARWIATLWGVQDFG